MTTQLDSIINEIETQRQKPLNVQLDDFKIAGAKLICALDNYLASITTKEDES